MFGRFESGAAGGTIPPGALNHLPTDLPLEFLPLAADLIKLVEDRLEFFRR
jgi:hypothetical protein